MKSYTSSIKGQKGFSKKYKVLGESKHMRVPLSVYDEIKTIIDLLEVIGKKDNLDKVHKVLESISYGLDKVVDT
jgi:hypothetical protein